MNSLDAPVDFADGTPAEPQESGTAACTVIIGAGPSGMRAAHRLSAAGRTVLILDRDPHDPYNRVKLTPLLAGDVSIGEIRLPAQFSGPGRVDLISGCPVRRIDLAVRRVLTEAGRSILFDDLILATGSNPFVPVVPGGDHPGVFVFRDAADVSALIARSASARAAVVVGGGLLGLEAARGLARRGLSVTIIEHETRLMPRQLDEEGARALEHRVEALGVSVRTGTRLAEIEAGARIKSVWLADGSSIACDTVVFCTGVRANTQLAKAAGLSVARGIRVDSSMRTSASNVYAIGECAEHEDRVVGLAGPAQDQAEAAVRAILGETAPYRPQPDVTKLKLFGADVFSIGPVERLSQQIGVTRQRWSDGDRYRSVFFDRGRLAGAIGVGGWDESSRLQQAINRRAFVYPWMVARFRLTGRIWREREDDPGSMPDAAIACNCTGVTCGQVRSAGTAIDEVRRATGANTVCGSCGPLIEEILGAGGPPKPVRLSRPLLWLSGAGGLAALATVALPRVPVPDTFGPGLMERLWFDGIWKQWSGYILLGLSIAAMAIGLRKRIRVIRHLGAYDWWRLVHLGIGAITICVLFAHTGFRFGANLNAALMASFSATLIFGAVAGLATGGEHKLRERGIGSAKSPPRGMPVWLHVLAIWPLPVLIALHVLSVYAY